MAEVGEMERAALLLVGTHDFANFQKSGANNDQRTSVRTIFRCAIEPRYQHGGSLVGHDIVVEGDGFLRKQVRLIAGTLVAVGMG